MTRSLFISGGGPSGLAAALLFHQLGWERITLAEKEASASTFDKNKGFNYLIDARGQKLLNLLGLTEDLKHYGVENRRNLMTKVTATGEKKQFASPFWDPKRDSAYWSRRQSLQEMLFNAIQARNDGRITLLYGHSFADFDTSAENGPPEILIESAAGERQRLTADLVLACDGLRSAVREAMARHVRAPEGSFDMVRHPSPSSKLNYKVLNMPAHIPFAIGDGAADDNKMAFAFLSRWTEPRKAMALVAYPVADPNDPRTVNVIRLPDHELWDIDTPDALLDFLEDGFPQLPIRDLVSQQEAQDFAHSQPGRFPAPQYARKVHGVVSSNAADLHCLCIGDAAHAFPPDLGLGVNTALEDLFILSGMLTGKTAAPDTLGWACGAYDASQRPEREALARLVQTVAPYQYNQTPWKLKLWALRFFFVKALHKAFPKLVEPPAVLLAQNDHLTFSEIRARQLRNYRTAYTVLAALGIAAIAAAATALLG